MDKIFKNKKETKNVSLTTKQIEEIKKTDLYEKTYNSLFIKGQYKLMRTTYLKDAFWMDFLVLALAAFLTTIAFDYFISITGRTGIFPGGLGSVARFFAILTFQNNENSQASFYFVYYFLFNIPLMIFGYFKSGIKFTLTTILYILLSIAFDQMLSNIPVINPNNWNLLIDYKLLYNNIQSAWNAQLWLFVFAVFGGVILGYSYALTYKVGASTGGTDFITVWFSKKKNKDIGTINRNVNFGILFTVIIANTMLLSASDFNPAIKLSVLSGWNDNVFTNGSAFETSVQNWVETYGSQWSNDYNIALADKNNLLLALASSNGVSLFEGYSTAMLSLMRFKFIFGPSLFASFILVMILAIVVNAAFPKNVKLTILITTSKPDEVEEFLFQSGYKNSVLVQEVQSKSFGDKNSNIKLLTITLTVMNWKTLEKGVLNIDNTMNINTLRTKNVSGPFVNELKDERKQEFIKNRLLDDEKAMYKLEKEAIYLTYKKQNKSSLITKKNWKKAK